VAAIIDRPLVDEVIVLPAFPDERVSARAHRPIYPLNDYYGRCPRKKKTGRSAS